MNLSDYGSYFIHLLSTPLEKEGLRGGLSSCDCGASQTYSF